MFYYSYGKEPCNVKVLWKNPAFNHMSVALSKGIYFSGLLLCLENSLVFQEMLYLYTNQILGHSLVFWLAL